MSWCAGFVDAVSYLELRHLYTSHMTGNTAALASRALNADWHEAALYGWTIACFLIGLLISASLTLAERREGIRSAFAAALGLEVVLLALFVGLDRAGSAPQALLIFLPAAAMGIQTVTVTRVGSLRVYTTYLTGSLSKFAEAAAQYLFWFWDRTKGRLRIRIAKVLCVTPRQESARHALVTASLWMAFFIGAVFGAAGDSLWRVPSLGFPILLLALTIAVDVYSPAALGETGARPTRPAPDGFRPKTGHPRHPHPQVSSDSTTR